MTNAHAAELDEWVRVVRICDKHMQCVIARRRCVALYSAIRLPIKQPIESYAPEFKRKQHL